MCIALHTLHTRGATRFIRGRREERERDREKKKGKSLILSPCLSLAERVGSGTIRFGIFKTESVFYLLFISSNNM